MELASGIRLIHRGRLSYIDRGDGRPRCFMPWLGDRLAFMYDFIMRRSIFPKKFGADQDRHRDILVEELREVHGQRVLEVAAGSGAIADVLPPANRYVGTDVSPGLLKRAVRRMEKAGFTEAGFYVASVDDLPFADGGFDYCICLLSLNFFPQAERAFLEMRRVLAPGGQVLCCVPVPERAPTGSRIRGKLLSAEELSELSTGCGLSFAPIDADNGALFYFTARRE